MTESCRIWGEEEPKARNIELQVMHIVAAKPCIASFFPGSDCVELTTAFTSMYLRPLIGIKKMYEAGIDELKVHTIDVYSIM